MDWDLKMPPWDLAELARDAEPDLGSMVGSGSGGVAHQASASDCSVDLKLGGFGDLGLSSKWKDQMRVSLSMVPPSGSAAASSSSGSSKRARTPGNGVQNASCLVDGCTSDLSNGRDYHRRHKVCEVHSKTPVVMVNGQEQRFCQQCSRFHSLVEFDEVKRSCRKRLDGHNRRRRKPQPDTVNMGSLFANHQAAGPRFSSYSQMLPSASLEPNWAAAGRSEAAGLCGQQSPLCFVDGREQFPVPPSPSFPHGYREGKLFSFLQEGGGSAFNTRTTLEAAPVIRSQVFGSAESSKGKMFAGDGLPRVPDSDCALSLLSSPTQTSGINFGPILPAAERIIPVGQPLASAMHQYGGLGHYSHSPAASADISPAGFSCAAVEAEDARAAATAMISDAGDAGLHYQGIFHDGTSDGASSSSSQAIPFSWQ